MKKALFFAIFLQFLALLYLIFWAKFPLYFGDDLQIKTKIVDPRDIFRGNYVNLGYKFSFIDKNETLKSGSKIYANFDEKTPANFVNFSFKKPENKNYLTGKLNCFDYEICTIRYEIEAYFLPKNLALKLENLSQNNEFLVNLKVKNGIARIVNLQFQGVKY